MTDGLRFRVFLNGKMALEWSADGPSLALATGCSCRCHQTVQPGLVPCPGCAQEEHA